MKQHHTFLRYETLSTSGQADHDDAYSRILNLNPFPICFLIGDHRGVTVRLLAVIEELDVGLVKYRVQTGE